MEIDSSSMNNGSRSGRFTSSKVWQLIDTGRSEDFSSKGVKYIQEKLFETRFETTLDTAPYNEAMSWGNLMEQYVYELIGFNYRLASKETLVHPKYPFWSGTPDCVKSDEVTGIEKAISEIKCYGKKKFALYVDAITEKNLEKFKSAFPQEYWQIVSNACIMGLDYGEALCFMPYRSQYEEIKEIAENMEGSDIWKYRFIVEKHINDLNFLPDDGYYDSINRFEFKIPKIDKLTLTARIRLAEKSKQDQIKPAA